VSVWARVCVCVCGCVCSSPTRAPQSLAFARDQPGCGVLLNSRAGASEAVPRTTATRCPCPASPSLQTYEETKGTSEGVDSQEGPWPTGPESAGPRTTATRCPCPANTSLQTYTRGTERNFRGCQQEGVPGERDSIAMSLVVSLCLSVSVCVFLVCVSVCLCLPVHQAWGEVPFMRVQWTVVCAQT